MLAGSAVSTVSQLELLETYARVITHMRRLPDTRRLVARDRVEVVDAWLTRLRGELRGSDGIHLRARTQSAQVNLEQRDDDGFDHHATDLGESEALHAWLNYTHARLRRDAEQAAAAGKPNPVPPEDYKELRRRLQVLGATGDVARVCLLPGAERVFTPRQVYAEFRRVDLTRWHRARFVAGFTQRWLRQFVGNRRQTTARRPLGE